MKNSFYEIVDREVQKALPANWKQIPAEKLLGKSPYRISHAFHSATTEGKSTLINILVLPKPIKIDDDAEDQLRNLRDYILSKNCLLVVISENESADAWGEVSIFVSESLYKNNANFLWLQCSEEKRYQTTVDYEVLEDLHVVLRDLWKGKLKYEGPRAGYQQVNLELMEDECWKCSAEMKTVTGIVFPDRQLGNWANAEWRYYNQHLSLSNFEGKNAEVLKQYVDQLRLTDDNITPIGSKYSHTIKSSYLAASCPYCNSLRGDHYVSEERIGYLHSLETRFDGSLEYHSIRLHIDDDLLDSWHSGYEGCDHTCEAGWLRRQS